MGLSKVILRPRKARKCLLFTCFEPSTYSLLAARHSCSGHLWALLERLEHIWIPKWPPEVPQKKSKSYPKSYPNSDLFSMEFELVLEPQKSCYPVDCFLLEMLKMSNIKC